MSKFRSVLVLLIGLALGACKTELYSSLPEDQANAMMALLIANGIQAEKGAAAKGMAPLSVPTSDLSQAIELLRNNGYPKDNFDNLGTVFEQQGLVASPLEERVRFIYGLSQALSETLTQIDGVISARVHIVLSETDTLSEKTGKSTASVFLKTSPGVDLSNKIPDIKQLVQASVQDLVYDDVVVSLFESEPLVTAPPALPASAQPEVSAFLSLTNPFFLGGFGVLLLIGAGGGVYVFIIRKKKITGLPAVQSAKTAATAEPPVIEND